MATDLNPTTPQAPQRFEMQPADFAVVRTGNLPDQVVLVPKSRLADYLRLIGGQTLNLNPGTFCVPGGEIPPLPVHIQPVGTPGVAANEEATVTGDPHVKEADGGKFDFQGIPGRTYNLLNDTGLVLNATFQAYNGSQTLTVMGQIGGMVSGPGGTSMIRIDAHKIPPVQVNGQSLTTGQTVRLADGGSLSLSQDGKTVSFSTKEGYQNTITVQGGGTGAYLDYSLKSGGQGVDTDGRMPGGLAGHTFDGDGRQRNGKTGDGAQGEGAIDGVHTDYEVPGGIFGFPQPQVTRPGNFFYPLITNPDYQNYFGIPVGSNPALIPPDQIQQMWNQVLTDSINRSSLQNGLNATQGSDRRSKKLQLLLQLALNSGNMDLAMLLLSGLETSSANQVASGLVSQIQNLQNQRKGIADQIGKLGKDDVNQVQKLNMQAGDIGTEISLLQTFLQDVMSQKSEAQSMASNFLKSRHDTAMGIIRNMA